MKRKVLATVLGMAGLVGLAASSYGQGQVIFNTYSSTGYYPVTYGTVGQGVPANLAGTGAGQDVSVELGYFLGTSSTFSAFTLIPSTIQLVGTSTAPVNGTGPTLAGYIQGGGVTIPGYSSGPISFAILAWTGNFATAAYEGTFTWTESSVPSGPLATAGSFASLPGNAVLLPTTPVPEPTTLALAGLGGLASLVAFRRKQA